MMIALPEEAGFFVSFSMTEKKPTMFTMPVFWTTFGDNPISLFGGFGELLPES